VSRKHPAAKSTPNHTPQQTGTATDRSEPTLSDEPPDLWSGLFEADSLAEKVSALRDLCRAAHKDAMALQVLADVLPDVDRLLADVQAALGQRN
jgi:hypothetical protein